MTTTASTRLRDDVYKNYEAARQAHAANPNDDAAKAELRATDEALAVELMAFAKRMIYAKYGDRVHRIDDHEIIIHDAGTHLFQQLARPGSIGNGGGGFNGTNGNGKKCSLSTWAWSVVDHYMLARIEERIRVLLPPNGLCLAETVEHPAPSPYKRAVLVEVLSSMSEKERQLWDLKVAGMTIPEIAEKLGKAKSTIDYRWHKITTKIRKRHQQHKAVPRTNKKQEEQTHARYSSAK